jgi:GNAT superfamily N-acetyltransferase
MKIEEVRALYDLEQRREPEDPAMLREVVGPIVRLVSRHDRRSCVIYSSLNSENVDAAIEEQIEYFNALGHGFEWKVYSHDTPADLKERLMARGFALDETEAILVLDLGELPATLAGRQRHDVRRVVDTDGLRDLLAVRQAVWGDDTTGLEERLIRELRDQPDRTSCYVAYVDAVAASAARLNFDPNSQFASLWGGSTVPAFRKQGLFTSLVAVRAQEARQRGARFLTVDARPMSRPILERLGFKLMAYANALNWRM